MRLFPNDFNPDEPPVLEREPPRPFVEILDSVDHEYTSGHYYYDAIGNKFVIMPSGGDCELLVSKYRLTRLPNLSYAEELAEYERLIEAFGVRLAIWNALKVAWEAETAIAQKDERKRLYEKLRLEFDNPQETV